MLSEITEAPAATVVNCGQRSGMIGNAKPSTAKLVISLEIFQDHSKNSADPREIIHFLTVKSRKRFFNYSGLNPY